MTSRLVIGLLLVLAGCGGSTDGVAITVDVDPLEPPLRVTVNGMPGGSHEFEFGSQAELEERTFTVESWYQDVLIDRMEVNDPCRTCAEGRSVREISVWICAFANGDLRYGSTSCDGDGWSCIADGFCAPPCNPLGANCPAEDKCSLDVRLAEPRLAQLSCVPTGNVPIGGVCRFGSGDDETDADDCVRGALCIDGRCASYCTSTDDCEAGETCQPVPELAATDPFVSACYAGS